MAGVYPVPKDEIEITSSYATLTQKGVAGDFRFVVLESTLNNDDQFGMVERLVLQFYYLLKYLGITEEQAYGLNANLVTKETVPLNLRPSVQIDLVRV